MAVKPILQLGNPRLLKKCRTVKKNELDHAIAIAGDLKDTIQNFRQKFSWGRAIAAPQIGVLKRIIFLEIDAPVVLINPLITAHSQESIKIWDDCMSFPDLLVKVSRYVSCNVIYRDELWEEKEITCSGALSELLQHEIDHLDGILATMRAIDGSSFALQSQRSFLSKNEFANNI